jgi:hypothetical protein
MSPLGCFLAVTACCSLIWLAWRWQVGQMHDANGRKLGASDKLDRFTLVSLPLLSLLYGLSIYVLGLYLRPQEKRPYFLNPDYHFLANSDISFRNMLTLFTNSDSYAASGLYRSDSGTLTAAREADGSVMLRASHLLTPVFQKVFRNEPSLLGRLKGAGNDSAYTPLNVPFDADVRPGFAILNPLTELRISIAEDDSGNTPRTVLTGSFRTADPNLLAGYGMPGVFTDRFRLSLKKQLKKGYSLQDLLLRAEEDSIGSRSETAQILADWLEDLGNCYLLVRYRPPAGGGAAARTFAFFPSPQFLRDHYSLTTLAAVPVAYNGATAVKVPAGALLYCGFGNEKERFSFVSDSLSGETMLRFSEPQYRSLRQRGANVAAPGTQYLRRLSNHYTDYIGSAEDEGYLFHENLRRARGNTINASLIVRSGMPTQPLMYKVYDAFAGAPAALSGQGSGFRLQSDDPEIAWHYTIRDFSEAGISYNEIFRLLTILYLLTALLLGLFPSIQLSWIEPVIFYVLYALVFTRCILLWRLATFPPAGDATAWEIEQYTRFEFFHGVPFTLVCIVPMFVLLYWRRWRDYHRQSMAPGWIVRPLKAVRTKIAKRRPALPPQATQQKYGWLQWISARFRQPENRVVVLHLALLILCGILLKAHVASFLTRIVTMLVPVCSYLICVQKIHTLTQAWASYRRGALSRRLAWLPELLYHGYDSRETLLSLFTLGYLMLTERGFGVLFLLFLLFKTIVVSFKRRPFMESDTSLVRLLLSGRNYWIFGWLALLIYCAFLSQRGLFHQALVHMRWLAFAGAVVVAAVGYVILRKNPRLRWTFAGITIAFAVIVFIWPLGGWTQGLLKDRVRHVAHRASLIYMPVDTLISRSPYNSSEERKILETAESQWFINSYLNKPRDKAQRISFRPFFNRGVNYFTQANDIVLPRFVIAELGNDVMLLMLSLLAMPVIIWLVFYRAYELRIASNGREVPVLSPNGYSGLLALILLFTIGLFVWLSATNRFVFFGQDFPFTSVTSHVSVFLPTMLLFFLLCSKPSAAVRTLVVPGTAGAQTNDGRRHIRAKAMMSFLLFLLIAAFIFFTKGTPQLNERDFTVRMNEADSVINNVVDKLFRDAQASLPSTTQRRQAADEGEDVHRPDAFLALRHMSQQPAFKALKSAVSPYTWSLMERLVSRPSTAFQARSPVYLRYDDAMEQYTVSYNRNLFRELPAYEEGRQWRGDVYEWIGGSQSQSAGITIGRTAYPLATLPDVAGEGAVKVALLPGYWLPGRGAPLALVNVRNDAHSVDATLYLCNNEHGAAATQDVRGFAQELQPGMVGYIIQGRLPSVLRYELSSGRLYARNCYINGRQRMVYPLAERCFWVSQYARAMSTGYSADSLLDRNAPVTLDYALTDGLQRHITESFRRNNDATLHRGFRFAVIAADGDGNIRLMADHAQSRKSLDPNDRRGTLEMEQRNFFYRELAKEREQWGNLNLIQMGRGPGSSIKPVVFVAVASEVNAGWQDLQLVSNGGVRTIKGKTGLTQYAGLDLSTDIWKSSESAEFSPCDFRGYMVQSINLYHSLLLFLGSYTREQFGNDRDGYSLRRLLTTDNERGQNETPVVTLGTAPGRLHLLPYQKDQWPATGGRAHSYFGNPSSVLASGISSNFGLHVEDHDKHDRTIYSRNLVNIGDPLVYDTLRKTGGAGFPWSYPESSDFIQENRTGHNPLTNFRDGLKNPTRGGFPYHVTPFKMAEMFGILGTYNAAYRLRLSPDMQLLAPQELHQDNSWRGNFRDTLKEHLFPALAGVLADNSGTARALFGNKSTLAYGNGQLYCYAKTGTIGSEGKKGQSRRLAVLLATEDLAGPRAQNARIYTVYFTSDRISEHWWHLYRHIINAIINSETFRQYMTQTHHELH